MTATENHEIVTAIAAGIQTEPDLAAHQERLPRTSLGNLVLPPAGQRVHLRPAEQARYGLDGYLVVPHRLKPDDLEQLNLACDGLDRLVAGESCSAGDFNLEAPGCLRRVKNLIDHSPVFLALALHPALVGIARCLLDGRVTLYSKGVLMAKGAGVKAEKRWHQDSACFDDPESEVVTLWIPLQDTDETTGALWVLPGSHLAGPVDPGWPDAQIDPPGGRLSAARVVPMRAGDILVTHRHTLHYSGPNRAGEARRVPIFRYQGAAL